MANWTNDASFINVKATFFCIFSIFSLCCFAALTGRGQNRIESDEYLVMGDLIRRVDQGDKPDRRIVLNKLTTARSIEGIAVKSLKRKLSLSDDLIEDFNRRNASEIPLENLFRLKANLYLFRNEDRRQIFKSPYTEVESVEEKDWKEFQKRYQTASIETISRPGFNAAHTLALVELGSQYGYLAGIGYWYLLEKTQKGWKIRKRTESWIS